MVLVYPVAFWQQQNQTPVDPHAGNVVLFLKGDQSTNTTTTANFTVPAVNSTVTINVVSSVSASANRAIRIDGGAGNYIITAVPNGTQITARNCGGSNNATAGTVINSGATVALSIIDSSASPKTISAFGNSQINVISQQNFITFDGDGDYLDCSNDAQLNPTTALSVDAWVYLLANPSTTLNPAFIDKWNFPSNLRAWSLGTEAGKLGASVSRDGSFTNRLFAQNDTSPSINTWYHVCFTYDGQNLRFYTNGVLSNSASYGSPQNIFSTEATNVWVGRSRGEEGTGRFINARISRPRIYNIALTASEVLERFNQDKSIYGL